MRLGRPRCPLAPQLAATPWGGSPPRPLCQKICYSDCTENCPLRPLGAPPARRGSRSRPPLRRPRPLRFEKAPSASVESIEPRPPRPCEVERQKERRRKNRRQSHTFFLA